MNQREQEHRFFCPKCGERMWVKDSRPTVFNGKPAVRRRRVCKVCNFRLSTLEAVFSKVELQPQRLVTALRSAHVIIGDLIANIDGDEEEFLEAAE